jgi:hypothetical protein
MKTTKDAMLSRHNAVNVSDPEVTGIDQVPNDAEPLMLLQRSADELSDYDDGFKCGYNGGRNNGTKSQAWQRGWSKSHE